MDTPWMVRQGDVALIAVDEIPADAEPIARDANRRVVLAYGERTGHAHALHESGVQMLRAVNADVFLKVVEPAFLRHEEHSRIAVPPGQYRVIRQVEYRPGEIITVAD
jgi:hypothetical protein